MAPSMRFLNELAVSFITILIDNDSTESGIICKYNIGAPKLIYLGETFSKGVTKCNVKQCNRAATRFLYGAKFCEDHYKQYVGRKKQEE